MVSICSLISKSSSPYFNPLKNFPRTPITIRITVTSLFHIFSSSLARSICLSLFSLYFHFTLWSTGMAKTTIQQVFLFCWLSLGLVVWTRLGDPFISQNLRQEWPLRYRLTPNSHNVQSHPLIESNKILVPPFHIKLGVMRNFVKVRDREGSGIAFFREKFPRIIMEKL